MSFSPLMRKIKNNTATAKTWMGVQIQPGAYYTIDGIFEAMQWARSPEVNSAILSGDIITNDGITDIADPEAAKTLLRIVRRANFPITTEPVLIQLSSYKTVGKYIWVKNRNVTYRDGTVLLDVSCNSLSVQVRVVDATTNTVLGTSPIYSTDGIYSFAFNDPVGDAKIEVQVKMIGIAILTSPSVNCLTLEWDT